jgi:TetR/AcrR family fatty acid metabolism transcriptional regulator
MKNNNMKEKIIIAAVKVFTRRGFFETRVEDIARCAGIAKGTVYLYFKDKPSLYAGIVDEHFRGAVAMLKQTVGEKMSPTMKLEKIAEDWIGFMLKFRGGFGLEMIDNMNLTSRIMKAIHRQAMARVNEITALVSRIISEGIERGEFVRTDPRIGAYFFLNAVKAAFSIQLFVPGAKDGEKEIIRIMLEGLKKRGG